MSSIGIVIPAYNAEKTIQNTLLSLQNQSVPVDQVVIVNDGSTDSTEEKIKPFLEQVQYISQSNQGAPVARNEGFKLIETDYVVFLDDDIILTPNALERMRDMLDANEDASYSYSHFLWGHKIFKAKEFNTESLQKLNYIHTSAMIRSDDFPGFDPELKKFQDWDLWLTMLSQGKKGVFIDDVLYAVVIPMGSKGISSWLPSFMYKIPWKKIGWIPKRIERYNLAMEIIKKKHHLI